MALTEPRYLLANPVAAFLSETRPTRLSQSALSALNLLLDELLQNFLHAALAPAPEQSGYLASVSPSALGPLELNEVFTVERFKASVIRTVGPRLGQMAVLEGGVAIQELLSLSAPSLRGHPALKRVSGGGTGGGQNAEEVFRSLRAWVQAISRLGAACPPSGPATLTEHLVLLTPPTAAPSPSSPHLSFTLALYAERCLMAIAERIVERVGRVIERSSGIEAGGILEVEAALGEDDMVFVWYSEMRCRARIEAEVAQAKARASGGGSGSNSPATNSPLARMSSTRTRDTGAGRVSHDSSSVKGSTREGSTGLGISEMDPFSDGFDELISSGKTMKVSLTPDRLRTMEKPDRARGSTNQLQRPKGSSPSVSSASPISTTTSPPRRLKARGPAVGINEEEDDDDDTDDDRPREKRRKESLQDILNSPPPGWSDTALAIPVPPGISAPGSAPMASSLSKDSIITTSSAGRSDSSDAYDAWANSSPAARKRNLKAKDERKDLASERQINSDLVDFFQAPPPNPPIPPPHSPNPAILAPLSPEERFSSPSLAPSPKPKQRGLRGLFSKSPKLKDEGRPGSPGEDGKTLLNSKSSMGRGSTRSAGSSPNLEAGPLAAVVAADSSTYSDPPLRPLPSDYSRSSSSNASESLGSVQVAAVVKRPPLDKEKVAPPPVDTLYPTITSTQPSPPMDHEAVMPSSKPMSSPPLPPLPPAAATSISWSTLPAPPSAPRKTNSARSAVSTDAASFTTAPEGRRSTSPPTEEQPTKPIAKLSSIPISPAAAILPESARRGSSAEIESSGRKESVSGRVGIAPPVPPARRVDRSSSGSSSVITNGKVTTPPRSSIDVVDNSIHPATANRRPSVTAVAVARERRPSETTQERRPSENARRPSETVRERGSSEVNGTSINQRRSLDEVSAPTLREIKARMAKMQTADQCIALLEEMLRNSHVKEDSGFASAPSPLLPDDKKLSESFESARKSQGDHDEQLQANLVEFFLGGGDVVEATTTPMIEEVPAVVEARPRPSSSSSSVSFELTEQAPVTTSESPERRRSDNRSGSSVVGIPGGFELDPPAHPILV